MFSGEMILAEKEAMKASAEALEEYGTGSFC